MLKRWTSSPSGQKALRMPGVVLLFPLTRIRLCKQAIRPATAIAFRTESPTLFCSANQSGFIGVEEPPIEDDAAREPRACQENSGEGTHQPRWKMAAHIESPFFLNFSESLCEQGAVGFRDCGTIGSARCQDSLRGKKSRL